MLKYAMKKFYFFPITSFSKLDEEYGPETGNVLTEKEILILASPPSTARRARGQSCSVENLALKSNMSDVVRLVGNATAPRSHKHIFCLPLMFTVTGTSVRRKERYKM